MDGPEPRTPRTPAPVGPRTKGWVIGRIVGAPVILTPSWFLAAAILTVLFVPTVRRLAPHLELSQAPVRWGLTYDTYIGETERRRLGDAFWSRRVRAVVEALRPVFLWDRLYIGGGNSRRIRPEQLERMGDDVVVVPNTAGIVGGVRAWSIQGTNGLPHAS